MTKSAEVLGRLLLMQVMVNNLPDKKSIVDFVCSGLDDLPGIENVTYLDDISAVKSSSLVIFNVSIGSADYGNFVIQVDNTNEFEKYEEHIRNFVFMIAVILEERKQREEIERNKALLEQRIKERTEELYQTNTELRLVNHRLQYANERFQEMDRIKSEFVSLASHELRTPLSCIMGFTQTLLSNEIQISKPEHDKYLRIIETESFRLAHLISDLLNLSRIEKDTTELNRTKTDLLELINETVKNVKISPAINFRVYNKFDYRPFVNADREAVIQVFVNLIDNAIRHISPVGTLEITVKSYTSDFLMISVADNGTGIPPEDLHKIFDRFYRVRNDRIKKSPGSGLGLSIVKEIITKHGGEIWVESQPGAGATFNFTLPLSG